MSDPIRKKGGFGDLVGYELTLWDADRAEVALTLDAHHMNRSGVMHGGVLTTLMDTACGYAGTFGPPGATPRRAFTLSLDAQFIGAARSGERLVARAERSGGGRSIFFSTCRVLGADGRLVGQGSGTFKYITKPV
jgi:uncharacterized protein (TIGR00369 family)